MPYHLAKMLFTTKIFIFFSSQLQDQLGSKQIPLWSFFFPNMNFEKNHLRLFTPAHTSSHRVNISSAVGQWVPLTMRGPWITCLRCLLAVFNFFLLFLLLLFFYHCAAPALQHATSVAGYLVLFFSMVFYVKCFSLLIMWYNIHIVPLVIQR